MPADDDSGSDDDDKGNARGGSAPPAAPPQPQTPAGLPVFELPVLPEMDISDAEKMELVRCCTASRGSQRTLITTASHEKLACVHATVTETLSICRLVDAVDARLVLGLLRTCTRSKQILSIQVSMWRSACAQSHCSILTCTHPAERGGEQGRAGEAAAPAAVQPVAVGLCALDLKHVV